MMRILLFLTCVVFLCNNLSYGQVYNMSNNSVTDATGTLYDSGGPNGEYDNNEDFIFTVCPPSPCECVKLDFDFIDLEFNNPPFAPPNFWDLLYVHNGSSTSAPEVASLGGTGLPYDIYLDSGCVTFHFVSDINNQPAWQDWDGWEVAWSCSPDDCPETIQTSASEYTTSELIEDVFVSGSCVDISNITFTGTGSAVGSFSNGSAIGIEEGIVLSTGFLSSIPGLNNSNGISNNLPAGGDSDLDDIIASTGETTEDASILEFDFVPTTNEISFKYVFASDEYPEYVCSEYNDVFAFFISGPGFTGNENIALVPGSSTAVAINSVNNGSVGSSNNSDISNCTSLGNSAYYVDNIAGPHLEFDGFTTVLTATADVTPCESYHIKLAVADVGDSFFDSAVFLEANSFAAGEGAIVSASTANTSSSSNEMYEGCQAGFFLFERGNADDLSSPFTIDFEIGGSATAGIDYSPFPGSIVIPAGETSIQIDITAYLDGLLEGSEDITVTVLNNFCVCDEDGSVPAILTILDNTPVETSLSENDYCLNDLASLVPSPTGGIPPYTYQWSNNATSPSLDFNVNPTSSGTYYVTVTDDCNNESTAMVEVTFQMPPPPVDITPPDLLCGDNTPISLQASHPNGIWSGSGITDADAGTFDPAVAQISDSPPFIITYSISNNCGNSSESINIDFEDLPTATISGTGMLCPGATNDIDLTVTFTGDGPWSFTYAIDNVEQPPIDNISGNPYTLTVNGLGDYTLTEVSNANCEGTVGGLVSITEFDVPDLQISGGGSLCNPGDFVNIDFTITGGTGPYDIIFTDGTTNFTETNMAGSYDLDTYTTGDYEIVSITDANGCDGTFSGLAPVTSGDLNIDNATPNTANCGNTDGSIDNVLVSGGNEPYTFTWYDATDTEIGNGTELSSLAAGVYTLVVSDDLLCADTLEITIDETLPPIVAAGTSTSTFCDESNGQITGASVSGGTEPYFYFWKDELGNIIGNDLDLADMPSGNYTLLVNDFNGCKDSIEMTIDNIPPPNLTGGTPNNASCGQNNGNITGIFIQNGTAPFNYLWTDLSGAEVGTSIDLTDVPTGTYQLLVTDDNGCTQTLDFTIEDSLPPEINSAIVNPATCGEDNGSITDIFIQGGTSPLFYEWQDESGFPIEDDLFLNGVSSGSYTLIVTDINGCSDEFTYNITNSPPPFISGGEVSVSICGNNNGSVTDINIAGGTEPFTYEWQDNTGLIVGEELDLAGVGLGDYTLIITDSNGCTDEVSFGVLELSGPNLSIPPAIPATCEGDNGAIEGVEITGGTEPFTIEWRNEADSLIATSQDLQNLYAGTYSILVTDANGCTTDDSIQIEDTPLPQIVGGEATPSSCGNSDGAIAAIEVTGGTGELTYEWQNTSGESLGETDELNDIPQGNYTLIVTDENGCETSTTFDIADLEAPQLSGGETQNTTCSEANGNITNIVLEGGVAPFTYEWQGDDGAELSAGEFSPEVLELQNISQGLYTFVVTDSKGCAVSLQFSIEDAPSPQLSEGIPTETTCDEANGSIEGITIEGGTEPFVFEWKNESGDIVGEELAIGDLLTGNYTLQITDFNGCADDIELFVPEVSPPQLQGGNITPTTCSEANGSIEGIEITDGTAPFEYFWTNDLEDTIATSTTLVDAMAGDYTLAVLDANGCVVSLQWTIEDQTAPQLAGGNITPSSCGKNDGAIQNIEATGGTGELTYEWQAASGEPLGGELELTEIAAGEYTLIVTDENGCSDQLSFVTFDEAAPQLSGGIIDPSNCEQADGNITNINIEGGNPPYTYAWTNADGGSHGEEISLSNAPQGNYVLTATDVDGCSTTLSFEILDTEAPVLAGGVIAPTTCSEANGSVEGIEVNGGNGELTFTWLDNENSEVGADLNLNTVLAGTYTFIATDEEGCTAELQFEIPDEAAPQVIEGLVNNSRCSEENGGISNVVIEGGIPPYSYNWTDASNNGYENTGENEATLLNIAAGVYDLEVMDANGCVASLAFEVLDEASPVASGGVVNASTCSEENGGIEGVEIEGGTAPFRFEWRDTNGNLVSEAEDLSGVLAGNYAVQIIDDNGCETDLAFEIPNIAAPILSEGTIDLSSCGNSDGGVLGVKVEGGTEPYTFTWQDENGEVFGDEIDLTDVTAGTYTLIVSDFNNCDVSLGFNVSDVGAPSISGGTPNQTICGSQDGEVTGIEVSGGTGALAIRWTNLEGEVISENLEISDLAAGEYTFTVEDEGGCIASQSFVIDDIPPPMILGATATPASCGASDGRISEVVLTDGSSPFRFEWSNADTNEVLGEDLELGGLTAGTYILIVMDDNNCSDSREFVLENLDAPELSLDDVTISDCTEEGTGSATVKVLGGTAPFDFEWDTDPPQFAPTASNLKPGDYNVSVRDGNDCLAVLPVTVPGFMPSPIVDCSLQTTESLEFVWTAVIGAVGYGIETDLGITDTVPAEQLSYLLAGIPDDLTVVISVTALGPDFCDNSETVIQSCATLADCPTIELSIEAANDIFCINEAGVILDASPEGGVFEGTGMNGNSFDPALAGVGGHTISYTFVDEMGCDFSANQILNVVEAPIAAIEMPEVICLGENTEISFIGTLPEGASLQWDFGNGTTSNEIGSHNLDWNETGVYTVQLSVDNGVCVDAMEVELIVSDISIEASEDQTVRSGTDIDLSAIVNTEFGNLESLEWLPSLENLTGCIDCPNTTARPFEATNYTVIATNEYGCQAVADIGVEIIPVPVLVVPNAFSPNGDGINDFFKIEGRNIESIEIKIYSRWGEKVFEGHSLDDVWDGFFKDKPLELGVYVYYARAFSFDGEEVFVKGNISLIR